MTDSECTTTDSISGETGCTDLCSNSLICSVCLNEVLLKGGHDVAVSPGCCGQMFHMECINVLVRSGHRKCPNCRVRLPKSLCTHHANSSGDSPSDTAMPNPPCANHLHRSQFVSPYANRGIHPSQFIPMPGNVNTAMAFQIGASPAAAQRPRAPGVESKVV